jgi:hypothetical protein
LSTGVEAICPFHGHEGSHAASGAHSPNADSSLLRDRVFTPQAACALPATWGRANSIKRYLYRQWNQAQRVSGIGIKHQQVFGGLPFTRVEKLEPTKPVYRFSLPAESSMRAYRPVLNRVLIV